MSSRHLDSTPDNEARPRNGRDGGENPDWHDQMRSASRLLAATIDRLGLEERHENLSKSSPFYKKVSSAVLPPLRSTLNLIHGPPEPAYTATNETEHSGTQSADSPDFEDVASPVSDPHGSSSILSLLATASAFAGATSLKAIGSILHDRYKDEEIDGNENFKDQRVFGDASEIEDTKEKSKEDSEAFSEVSEDIEGHANEDNKDSKSFSNNVRRTSTLSKSSITAAIASPVIHRSSVPALSAFEETRPGDFRLLYSSEIMAKALTNGDYRPPPENLRSTWENSVMKNHRIKSSGNHALIRYETNSEAEESARVAADTEKNGKVKSHTNVNISKSSKSDELHNSMVSQNPSKGKSESSKESILPGSQEPGSKHNRTTENRGDTSSRQELARDSEIHLESSRGSNDKDTSASGSIKTSEQRTRDYTNGPSTESPANMLDGESPEKTEILQYHIALKLKETFAFDDENYLYGRFDVWLIRDVLLQGHMYITRDFICFYSLLPGKFSATELNDPELTIYSGALGHKLAHYGDSFFSSVYTHRFWAVLKPQTLSIYTSPTKLYFPVRTIDLRTAVSCEIVDTPAGSNSSSVASPKLASTPADTPQVGSEVSSIAEEANQEEDVQSGVWFKINCVDKSYRFHTSSIYSARHWYNSISKAIFSLHNTNNQREVLLRLPIEDIVDYKKNFVLAEAGIEEPKNAENLQSGKNKKQNSQNTQTSPNLSDDSPISFSIKFNMPTTVDDSKIQKLKAKTRNGKESSPQDSAHFVVFQKGDELRQTFEKALEANVLESASRNRKAKKKKGKQFFRDERAGSSNPDSKTHKRVVSTVNPDYSSGGSVIDKIVDANTKIVQAREKEQARLIEAQKKAENGEIKTDSELTKSSYIPSLKSVKDRFMPKSSSTSSMASGDGANGSYRTGAEEDNLPPQDFDMPDFDNFVHLPKPFSLQMLQNLDIQMIRKRRTFEEIAGQYGHLSELIKAKRAKDETFANSADAETETETENDNAESSSFLDKKDEENASAQEKSGKFSSLKSSLKSVTHLGGMWSTKPEHYDQFLGKGMYYIGTPRDRVKAINHFRNHFSLGSDSHLIAVYHTHLKRSVPVFGRLYVGKDQLCFRSMIPGVSTKMVLPMRDLSGCKKQSRMYHDAGLLVKMRGLEDLYLTFGSKDSRNDCQRIISRLVRGESSHEVGQEDDSNSSMDVDESENQEQRSDELAYARVHAARLRLLEDKISYSTGIDMPLILEDNPFTKTEVRLSRCYRIVLLTIGSRGDVQPYIALGKALVKEGHVVTIATHSEFEEWVTGHGILFKEIAGDPAELMQLMVTHGSISVGFLKEASTKFRGWISELLESSWKACQGAELLIESPSAMAGLHIAEALNIPYMRAFTMPWTRTKAYPHAFLVPEQNRGGSYNFLTHVMFENVFWKGISGQVNRWRTETLGLAKTSLVKMQQSRVPFLYNVSPAMFPPSVDFPDWVRVTGYWFLDEGSQDYSPPEALVKFLHMAKENGEKVVYIGFGSIVVSDAKALTKTIVEAVVDSGVKCILNKGWSDKLSKSKDDVEVELPPQVYDAGTIPHDWLFSRIDAAVHHGGSGTTGATLRAGLPTIVKPFFGDQFFFASRVEDLGVGITLKHLNKKSFTKALKAVTSESKYLNKASEIARSMSHERGILSAIEAIYTELAYSRSLISVIRNTTEKGRQTGDRSGAQSPVIDEEAFDMISDLSADKESGEESEGTI